MLQIQEKELELLLKKNNTKEFLEIIQEMKVPKYKISDIGITHRWITNWEDKGVLFSGKVEKSEKWRKFNFTEYVWLSIVKEARAFNIPLKTLKAVKDSLVLNLKFNDIFIVPAAREVLYKLAEKEGKLEDIEEAIEELKKSNPIFPINIFELIVSDILLLNGGYSFCFNLDGEVDLLKEGYEKHRSVSSIRFSEGNYISISMTKIISKFYEITPLSYLVEKLKTISPDQEKLLSLLKDPSITKATIHYRNNKTNEMDRVEIETEKNIDLNSRVWENIVRYGYQDLELKTIDGKLVNCKNIRKHKF